MARPALTPKWHARFGLLLVLALGGMTAGCFQPLYGDKATVGGADAFDKMRTVEVAPVVTTTKTRLPRVGVELRNQLIFFLTGGGTPDTTQYRLIVTLSSTNLQVVTDPSTGRADVQNYGIEASYQMVEIGTGKPVMTGTTFSRVSYNLPGQQQRFAGDRALRDAETRASGVIAENLRARLASYFTAGT